MQPNFTENVPGPYNFLPIREIYYLTMGFFLNNFYRHFSHCGISSLLRYFQFIQSRHVPAKHNGFPLLHSLGVTVETRKPSIIHPPSFSSSHTP